MDIHVEKPAFRDKSRLKANIIINKQQSSTIKYIATNNQV